MHTDVSNSADSSIRTEKSSEQQQHVWNQIHRLNPSPMSSALVGNFLTFFVSQFPYG